MRQGAARRGPALRAGRRPTPARPSPVPAPTTRRDFSTTGFTVTDRGEVWTMQEPYGAYTLVPRQRPAVPTRRSTTSPSTRRRRGPGSPTARLVDLDERRDDGTTTSWQLDEPASSYLITLADRRLRPHAATPPTAGLRVDYWTPRGMAQGARRHRDRRRDRRLDRERLGPYPFDSLGLVVTDSQSAMETQTMVTLGNTDYVLSPQVIAHELVHQWYGDQVSPADWRDVWLNEGMTMLMQCALRGRPRRLATRATPSPTAPRRRPVRCATSTVRPATTTRGSSAAPTSTTSPAADVERAARGARRRRVLPRSPARGWRPTTTRRSTREQIYAHWEKETGRELSAFFDAWIMGRHDPASGRPAALSG